MRRDVLMTGVVWLALGIFTAPVPGEQPTNRRAADRSTPERAFQVHRDALASKDWRRFYESLSPSSQASLLGAMVVWGRFTAADDDQSESFQAVLDKHQFPWEQFLKRLEEDRQAKERGRDSATKLMTGIPNQRDLFSDLVEWHVQHAPKGEFARLATITYGELTDVVIKCDTAAGRAKLMPRNRAKGDGVTMSIVLERIDDEWHVDWIASRRATRNAAKRREHGEPERESITTPPAVAVPRP